MAGLLAAERFRAGLKTFSRLHLRAFAVLQRPEYALSVRQPWATLLVAGRKTIEIRKWSTIIRGRVHIHAARLADRRAKAWALVPIELRPLTQLTGGLIGTADLTSCVVYRSAQKFADDVPNHLNDPGWFEPPQMYGFRFRSATPMPFHPCRGSVRFFKVEIPEVK